MKIFDSHDISTMVGIPPIYLNKLIERHLYGIKPSIRTGRGKGSRRLFSATDVAGVALVWWLFESGLRSQVIRRVLGDICKTGKADWVLAAKKLRKLRAKIVVIKRELKRQSGKTPRQTIGIFGANHPFKKDSDASIHMVPVGFLFSSLDQAINDVQKGARQ